MTVWCKKLTFMSCAVLAVVFMQIIYKYFFIKYRISDQLLSSTKFKSSNFIQKRRCKFAKFDPKDPDLQPYVKHPGPVKCNVSQPDLTYIDYDGYLRINVTEMEIFETTNNVTDITCLFRTFRRGWSGYSITYDSLAIFMGPTLLRRDFVEIFCAGVFRPKKNKLEHVYHNIHVHPSWRPKKTFVKPTESQLSVLMVMIDSLSYSMFLRNMPKTNEFVTKHMGMVMMKNFNKVGDNTVPNMVAALTGRRLYDEQEDMPREFSDVSYHLGTARLPFVWKRFAREKSYATAFNEDRPDVAMLTSGVFRQFFHEPPFDYFYPTYWRSIQNHFADSNLSFYRTYCFRNTPLGDLFVDSVKRHATATSGNLQFAFNAFAYFSHEENGELIEATDERFAELFRDLLDGGHLNRTFLLFMSDHGPRFNEIRQTFVGYLEERNPFLGIWFPAWFHELHPRLGENLRANLRRLSSSYDVHETLLDVLNGNYRGQQRPEDRRGQSLLYELPTTRTCTDAGIPRRFCLCSRNKKLNPNLPYLKTAAETVVKHLNTLLYNFPQCRIIEVRKVARAEMVDFGEEDSRESSKSYLRIAVVTHPKGALFEGMVIMWDTTKRTDHNFKIDGQIQRLNRYGATADCIKDYFLKNYCVCV